METRLYEIEEANAVYRMPAEHCVFCKHCESVVWDYENGPYLCFCNFSLEYETCGKFEDNGYVFDEEDYKARVEEKKSRQEAWKKLKQTEAYKTLKAEIDKQVEAFLNGEPEYKFEEEMKNKEETATYLANKEREVLLRECADAVARYLDKEADNLFAK